MPLMLFVDVFEQKLGYKLTLQELSCLKSLADPDCSLKRENFGVLNIWKKVSLQNMYSFRSQKLANPKETVDTLPDRKTEGQSLAS